MSTESTGSLDTLYFRTFHIIIIWSGPEDLDGHGEDNMKKCDRELGHECQRLNKRGDAEN